MEPLTRSYVQDRRPLRLDLGCGSEPLPGHVGVDLRGGPGIVASDAMAFLEQLDAASVDSVHSRHFLEHVDDPAALVAEVARVLVVGGGAHFIVPHFSNPYHHSDPTHRHTFGVYWMSYLVHDHFFKRRIRAYGDVLPLELVSVALRFRAAGERPWTNRFRRILHLAVEDRRWFIELYEASLTPRHTCYEVEFHLRRSEPAGGRPCSG